jgi:hypothetical protein
MNKIYLIIILNLFIETDCLAFEDLDETITNHESITDKFYRSSKDNTALGPKIKYPKSPRQLPASSERVFTGGQVNNIPFQGPAEALEIVPGLAIGR